MITMLQTGLNECRDKLHNEGSMKGGRKIRSGVERKKRRGGGKEDRLERQRELR
jgi:hypothetical protein